MSRRQKGLSFVEKKKRVSSELVKDILGTLFYCFAAILLGVVIVVAFGMRLSVIGISMSPSLDNGQVVLVDRFSLRLLNPQREDVVCFYPKGNENSHLYVKRIIGLPGETVQIKDGYVYVNGVRLLENEVFDKIEEPGLAQTEFVLKEGEYFVLGDNRNNSEDSRNGNIGAVTEETMVGKVWFKLKTDNNGMGFVK